jgi:hypothetical protein
MEESLLSTGGELSNGHVLVCQALLALRISLDAHIAIAQEHWVLALMLALVFAAHDC